MGTPSVFLVDVAPIVPLPYGKSDVFSYLSQEPLACGALVLVPFGPRFVRGIVTESKKLPKETFSGIRLKHVKSILDPACLTEEQLLLARIVSDECLTPLGRTLRHLIVERIKARGASEKTHPKKKALRLSKNEIRAAKTIADDTRPTIFVGPLEDTLRIALSVMRTIPKHSQVLVLVPEQVSIPHVERFFSEAFGPDIVSSFSSALSGGAQSSAWEKIRTGETRIVVGTRQSVFAPWKKLGFVVVLEASDMPGYKQWDMSPRYDSRRVAKLLSQIHGSILLFADHAETREWRYRVKQGELSLVTNGSSIPSIRPKIVNMREERYRRNFSLISSVLASSINEAIASSRQSILISNRSGLETFLVCESCKAIPRCPACDRALRSSREGYFKCPSCAFHTETFPRCASCGELSFKSVGGGTERIEREARKQFPKANIVRIDAIAHRSATKNKLPIETMRDADIVIGTASVLHAGELPKAGLVAIMDAENFLSFPDFRTDERFVGMIDEGKALLRDHTHREILIQTFHPERELFRKIGEGDERTLLDRSFEDRLALRYPPFFSIFRIGFREREEKEAEAAAAASHKRLSLAAKELDRVRVSSPQKPLVPKVRGRYERFILISIPEGNPFPETFREILSATKKNWVFDPNPLSLF